MDTNINDNKNVIAMFDFIQGLVSIEKKVIVDIKDYNYYGYIDTFIDEFQKIKINHIDNEYNDDDSNGRVLIEVEKPRFSPCPNLPSMLIPWVSTTNWKNFKVKEIQCRKEILKGKNNISVTNINLFVDDDNNVESEKFTDNIERVTAFSKWNKQRNEWREIELKKQKIQDLFDKFYSIYEDLKADSEKIELVIGNGIFNIPLNGKEHPLVLKKVKMVYDKKDKMQVIDSDSPTELYRDIFQGLPYIRDEGVMELQQEISNTYVHPMSVNIATEFLEHSSSAISTKCRSIKFGEPFLQNDMYVLYDRPVLLLREKQSQLRTAIGDIKDHIRQYGDVPLPLKEIIGCELKNKYDKNSISESINKVKCGDDEDDILLTKEANTEQIEIAKKIEYAPAIVVQGPPGTGKTHTIANLMGHFLAQGKHVLVTSYTQKALSVLKEKLPVEIQDLCVALLDDSKKDMEKSIQGISSMYSTHTADGMNKDVTVLKQIRRKIIKELHEKRNILLNIKRQESNREFFVYLGEAFSLSRIADFLNMHKDLQDVIPGTVKKDYILPLSKEELDYLYNTNSIFTVEEIQEMSEKYPSISELITPEEFGEISNNIKRDNRRIDELCGELDVYIEDGGIVNRNNVVIAREVDRNRISELEAQYLELELCSIDCDSIKRAICVGYQNGGAKNNWRKLNDDILKLHEIHQRYVELSFGIKIVCPDEYVNKENIYDTLDDIARNISKSGKLSIFAKIRHKDWVEILETIRINSAPIKNNDDWIKVKKYIEFKRQCNLVKDEYNQILKPLGETGFENLAELIDDTISIAMSRWNKVYSFLDWYGNKYEKFMSYLNECGIQLASTIDLKSCDSDIEKIEGVIRWLNDVFPMYGELCQIYFVKKIDERNNIDIMVNGLKNSLSSVAGDLIDAINLLNDQKYKFIYDKIVSYDSKAEALDKRNKLLSTLREVAPEWAECIEYRRGIHGENNVHKEVENAWKYKQFVMKLEENKKINVAEVENDVIRLTKELQDVTTKLAVKSSWYNLLKNVQGSDLKNNLVAWGKTMSKYGKGKGKNAGHWMSKAKELMVEVQKAVPAWIMPLSKVWANVKADTNKFDIIIIDEASQVDISAIPLLYFGNKIIIVGDDKQVSPSGIGVDTNALKKLQEGTIKDIVPNYHLYTADTSLYDIAQMNFETKMLKEHFRCVPEIIGYCNNLSYDNRILPLREAGISNICPVVSYRVDGHKTSKKENIEEAECIASLLKACLEQPEYKDKTFGAITMLGNEQALTIRNKIREFVDVAMLEKCDFLCGNAAQFQGDERDVVFLSLVDDNPGDGLMRTVSSGKGDETKKRYNVAVSRARDQIWIIHSMGIEDLKEEDMRHGLLEYANNPGAYLQKMNKIEEKADSIFEVEVARALVSRGFHIEQQWKVGAYSIDIVVMYKNKKIAIECDGERWHSTDEQLNNDIKRQAVLERLGWQFVRIRGSEYFLNKNQTIDNLVNGLASYGIFPEAFLKSDDDNSLLNELLERVEKRAYQILQEYKGNSELPNCM